MRSRRVVRHLVHRALAAVLLAGLFGATPAATTLAILRTPNQLVIAADSLMTLYDGRPQQACKIRRQGDIVFATAGLIVSSAGVLDAHQVITDVLRRPVTWTEHVQTIEDRLQEPLLRRFAVCDARCPTSFGGKSCRDSSCT